VCLTLSAQGLDYSRTGFLYSYTYKKVAEGDVPSDKQLADGDTILGYSRQARPAPSVHSSARSWSDLLAAA
jgi:hypothetical protein